MRVAMRVSCARQASDARLISCHGFKNKCICTMNYWFQNKCICTMHYSFTPCLPNTQPSQRLRAPYRAPRRRHDHRCHYCHRCRHLHSVVQLMPTMPKKKRRRRRRTRKKRRQRRTATTTRTAATATVEIACDLPYSFQPPLCYSPHHHHHHLHRHHHLQQYRVPQIVLQCVPPHSSTGGRRSE